MANILVNVVIEIERHSNKKWEYDHANDKLVLDRMLKYPYFYPHAYGFIPNTLGCDDDELDVLLISDKHYANYNDSKQQICGFIVGGLMMYDEKGRDDKIFVVPMDEVDIYEKKTKHELDVMHANIKWFFSNYKSQEENKWSRVERMLDKQEANDVYKQSILDYQSNLKRNES